MFERESFPAREPFNTPFIIKEIMTEKEITEIRRRLSSYRSYATAIDALPAQDESLPALRAELFFIRRSVLRLPESPEKLLLYRHFICGDTMERCAELLGISRRSVFRLQKRAFELYLSQNPFGEEVRAL